MIEHMKCSAKTGKGVDEIFTKVSSMLVKLNSKVTIIDKTEKKKQPIIDKKTMRR